MNLDEALGKITDPETKAFFEKMVKDQNSYITKLENQIKSASQQQAGGPDSKAADDITMKYLEKNMRRDVIAEAKATIRASIPEAVFNAVEKDYDAFLEANMKKQNTTAQYAIDAFSLVLGRCYQIKDHPVNQIGKAASPSGTPSSASGSNGASVRQVQDIISSQPPVMNPGDHSSQSAIPGGTPTQVKNTGDAFARLKSRFGQSGGNRFNS